MKAPAAARIRELILPRLTRAAPTSCVQGVQGGRMDRGPAPNDSAPASLRHDGGRMDHGPAVDGVNLDAVPKSWLHTVSPQGGRLDRGPAPTRSASPSVRSRFPGRSGSREA